MPKDLIHFKVAERTAKRLANSQYAPHLNQAPDGLFLGSVFHDAPFYAVTSAGKPLEALSHRLHGADGQDTFSLIRLQAEHIRKSNEKSLPTALFVGLVSHLYADVVMHPLVWHLTGNYYDDSPKSKSEARQRHRALESLMDMVACPEMLGRARYRLRSLLRRCPHMLTSGIPIAEIGDMALMQPKTTHTQLSRAWTLFSALQWFYSSPKLARSLFALRAMAPHQMAEATMLFYAPQLMEQANFLKGNITFNHPVTGRELASSLDQLIETSATKAEALCRQLAPALFNGAPLSLPGPGPSMDAGISGISTREMMCFSSTPFPIL